MINRLATKRVSSSRWFDFAFVSVHLGLAVPDSRRLVHFLFCHSLFRALLCSVAVGAKAMLMTIFPLIITTAFLYFSCCIYLACCEYIYSRASIVTSQKKPAGEKGRPFSRIHCALHAICSPAASRRP